MSDIFDDNNGRLPPARVKTNFDPPQPVEMSDVTDISTSNPHFIRFSIKRDPTVEEFDAGKTARIELANWGMRFPTRDAADSHRQDIQEEMKHMRGEPEQAWSDVAKMSKCPNPALLQKFRNLEMEIRPAPATKSEPIPRDHPAYPNSFAAQRDIVTGREHGGTDQQPRRVAKRNPPQVRNRADGVGPTPVRKDPSKPKAAVSRKRSSSKAGTRGKKQSAQKKDLS